MAVCASGRFRSIGALLDAGLAELGVSLQDVAQRTHLAIGAAGPVVAGRVKLTNLSYEVDATKLRRRFASVTVVNDLEAHVAAVPTLRSQERIALRSGDGAPARDRRDAPFAVIAPGTGYGLAVGLAAGAPRGGLRLLATESGHALWAPPDEAGERYAAWLRRRTGGRPTVEEALAGSRIACIAHVLAGARGGEPRMSNEDVMSRAHAGTMPEASAMGAYAAWLIAEAEQAALRYGARSGVYFAGGVARALRSWLHDAARQKVRNGPLGRGPMVRLLESISLWLADADELGLRGLAALSEAAARNTL
jgi:glucokinase